MEVNLKASESYEKVYVIRTQTIGIGILWIHRNHIFRIMNGDFFLFKL